MQTGQLRKSAGQGSLGSKKAVALSIRLNTGSAEPRVDSRALARLFGNHHRNVMVLIQKHAEQFKKFGHLLFETQVGERKQGGGKAERYARLNEDQAIYLLTLAKNNDRVVPLKAELVAAFRMARDRASVRATQYLPLYHSVHDAVEALIHRARECGSTTPDAIFHGNANRMLNSVLGITSGERENLTVAQQLTLSSLQLVFVRAVLDGLAEGNDHRTVTRRAKAACEGYMVGAGHLLLPPAVSVQSLGSPASQAVR
ncbi:Rha family transcriptional regulator [Pseudomonas tumuqii]|uniref:Rha family transcriptional regulator n=1 Tax=Pseudomonas tumuqii TaxID=2715755 RepID=UPI001557191C|nr:Rha family transcriptional regulator [Pseudomonas tumuqii]